MNCNDVALNPRRLAQRLVNPRLPAFARRAEAALRHAQGSRVGVEAQCHLLLGRVADGRAADGAVN